MADHNLTSPLLPPRSSDHPHVVVDVDVEDDDGPSTQEQSSNGINHNNHNQNYIHRKEDRHLDSTNPFAFLGSDWFEVPGLTTADPFRNDTLKIVGCYEWVKILICLPIALVRLVLFGVCLSVGYIATKLALLGWKDKQSPMPKWSSRVMWVTRFSARCILFSFGERLLAIDFPDFFCFLREPRPMEGSLFRSNWALSSPITLSKLLLFAILMYTLSTPGSRYDLIKERVRKGV